MHTSVHPSTRSAAQNSERTLPRPACGAVYDGWKWCKAS